MLSAMLKNEAQQKGTPLLLSTTLEASIGGGTFLGTAGRLLRAAAEAPSLGLPCTADSPSSDLELPTGEDVLNLLYWLTSPYSYIETEQLYCAVLHLAIMVAEAALEDAQGKFRTNVEFSNSQVTLTLRCALNLAYRTASRWCSFLSISLDALHHATKDNQTSTFANIVDDARMRSDETNEDALNPMKQQSIAVGRLFLKIAAANVLFGRNFTTSKRNREEESEHESVLAPNEGSIHQMDVAILVTAVGLLCSEAARPMGPMEPSLRRETLRLSLLHRAGDALAAAECAAAVENARGIPSCLDDSSGSAIADVQRAAALLLKTRLECASASITSSAQSENMSHDLMHGSATDPPLSTLLSILKADDNTQHSSGRQRLYRALYIAAAEFARTHIGSDRQRSALAALHELTQCQKQLGRHFDDASEQLRAWSSVLEDGAAAVLRFVPESISTTDQTTAAVDVATVATPLAAGISLAAAGAVFAATVYTRQCFAQSAALHPLSEILFCSSSLIDVHKPSVDTAMIHHIAQGTASQQASAFAVLDAAVTSVLRRLRNISSSDVCVVGDPAMALILQYGGVFTQSMSHFFLAPSTSIESMNQNTGSSLAASHVHVELAQVFMNFIAAFEAVEKQAAAEAEAAAALTKYKEKAIVIVGDDEALLQKAQQLFPSFQSTFSLEGAKDVPELEGGYQKKTVQFGDAPPTECDDAEKDAEKNIIEGDEADQELLISQSETDARAGHRASLWLLDSGGRRLRLFAAALVAAIEAAFLGGEKLLFADPASAMAPPVKALKKKKMEQLKAPTKKVQFAAENQQLPNTNTAVHFPALFSLSISGSRFDGILRPLMLNKVKDGNTMSPNPWISLPLLNSSEDRRLRAAVATRTALQCLQMPELVASKKNSYLSSASVHEWAHFDSMLWQAMSHSVWADEPRSVITGDRLDNNFKSTIDVYRETPYEELSHCREMVTSYYEAVTQRRSIEGMSQAVPLLRIEAVCKRLAAVSPLRGSLSSGNRGIVNVPLMCLAAGAEALLREGYEWERCCPQSLSLLSHLESISNTIIRWRRIELENWSRLASHRAAAVIGCRNGVAASAASHLLLHVPAMVRSGQMDADGVAAEAYKWGPLGEDSKMGDCAARLSLVRSLGRALLIDAERFQDMNTKDRLQRSGRLCLGLHQYWSTGPCALISTELRARVSTLEMELRNYTRVVRWQTGTFFAVKNSTEEARRVVSRVLRRLDDVLWMPTHLILRASAAGVGNYAVAGTPQARPKVNAWLDDPGLGVIVLEDEAARRKNDKDAARRKSAKQERRRQARKEGRGKKKNVKDSEVELVAVNGSAKKEKEKEESSEEDIIDDEEENSPTAVQPLTRAAAKARALSAQIVGTTNEHHNQPVP